MPVDRTIRCNHRASKLLSRLDRAGWMRRYAQDWPVLTFLLFLLFLLASMFVVSMVLATEEAPEASDHN